MLNDEAIRSLRTGAKSRKVFDEKGLYLFVTPTGGRFWRLKYRFPLRTPGSRESTVSLGPFPEISLEQARERRDAARRDIANGINPSLRRIC
jgi:hypothetical protein